VGSLRGRGFAGGEGTGGVGFEDSLADTVFSLRGWPREAERTILSLVRRDDAMR
jgi:hypothetical protein